MEFRSPEKKKIFSLKKKRIFAGKYSFFFSFQGENIHFFFRWLKIFIFFLPIVENIHFFSPMVENIHFFFSMDSECFAFFDICSFFPCFSGCERSNFSSRSKNIVFVDGRRWVPKTRFSEPSKAKKTESCKYSFFFSNRKNANIHFFSPP